MDSLASLALATEPPDPRLLDLPPFSRGAQGLPPPLGTVQPYSHHPPTPAYTEHAFMDFSTPTAKHVMGQVGAARDRQDPHFLFKPGVVAETVQLSFHSPLHIPPPPFQATYQLAVMCGLIFWAPPLLGMPDHASVGAPSAHYTIVFNSFVLMQASCGAFSVRQDRLACVGNRRVGSITSMLTQPP